MPWAPGRYLGDAQHRGADPANNVTHRELWGQRFPELYATIQHGRPFNCQFRHKEHTPACAIAHKR